MGISEFRSGNLVLGLCALCLLIGCRTVSPLPALKLSEPGWRIRHGQAIWRLKNDAPEIAGELLIATHTDGRTFLQFTKTPLPFVVAQTTSNSWQIEFVAENRIYSGPGRPPARLSWLQAARCFAGFSPSLKWNWQSFEDGRWRLEHKSSGEWLEGYLDP